MRMPCVKTPKVLITALVRKATRVMVIAVKVTEAKFSYFSKLGLSSLEVRFISGFIHS